MQQKPIQGWQRTALFLVAGLAVLLFYVYAVLGLVLVSALTFAEVLALIAAARFGLAFAMANVVHVHAEIMKLFFNSFWLRKDVEFQISLSRDDAPGLFALVEELSSRNRVAAPDEVLLEMNMNAWVRLKGLRRGGRTTLGLGYDMLCGLNVPQLRAVIAHEFTHARLVQRVHKRFVNYGLAQAVRLAGGLWALKEALARAQRSHEVCRICHRLTDLQGRWIATLVAACSRQDEFDADRGSVEMCGAASARSALVQVERLALVTARLPWEERVAQLQAGRPLSEWLHEELLSSKCRPEQQTAAHFNKYSTHPSLEDRLAAIPPSPDQMNAPEAQSVSAISLLADPRGVAERLLAEIQKIAAQQEERDSKRLRRWSRQAMTSSHLRPLQSAAVFVIIIGTVFGVSMLAISGLRAAGGAALLISWALGLIGYRLGVYREKETLPLPSYKLVKETAWRPLPENARELEEGMHQEFRKSIAGVSKKRERLAQLISAAYQALERCDYLRAHAAARLALGELDKRSVEAALALSVSAAALGIPQELQAAFQLLRKEARMKGLSVSWGASWALTLSGDAASAEAFLERALTYRTGNSILLTFLAFARFRRGKLQSAILAARQACNCASPDLEHWKLLADLLLNAGYTREAADHLERMSGAAPQDREVMLLRFRLYLLLRDFTRADACLQQLRNGPLAGYELLDLGNRYERARKYAEAEGLYQEALRVAHYPEALLGLGRIEAERQNKSAARTRVLEAFNTSRKLGERARGPLPLFNSIAEHLVSLEEPTPNCRAWIAKFDAGAKPTAFANTSLLVYAPEFAHAQQFVHQLLEAAEPDVPPVLSHCLTWHEAPRERQPEIPVRPGVQCVLN